MIYLELRRSSSMIFGLLRWSQSLQFLLVSLLLTSGCSSAQRSQRSRGVFCHFSPCFLRYSELRLQNGDAFDFLLPFGNKASKDLERSRMSSAMLSCCPMSLGHVTCHIMSQKIISCHISSSSDYETPKRQFHTQTIHGAAIYGAPWIPSIDPLYVSIYYIYIYPAPAGSYGYEISPRPGLGVRRRPFGPRRRRTLRAKATPDGWFPGSDSSWGCQLPVMIPYVTILYHINN